MSSQGWAAKSEWLLALDENLNRHLLEETDRGFLRRVVTEPFECYYMDKAWIERKTQAGLHWLRSRGFPMNEPTMTYTELRRALAALPAGRHLQEFGDVFRDEIEAHPGDGLLAPLNYNLMELRVVQMSQTSGLEPMQHAMMLELVRQRLPPEFRAALPDDADLLPPPKPMSRLRRLAGFFGFGR